MKKVLTLTLLLIGGTALSQTVDAGNDTTICPAVGCADLVADFTPGGLGSPVTSSYLNYNIPYAPDPFAGTAVALTDDSQTGLLPIGFTFSFYGVDYTQFVICSNNWIGFQTGETSTWVTSTVPSTAANRPRNCIMGPWQDINPSSGGTIRYQTLGTAPCRRLVVTYDNVPMFSCTAMTFRAQIIIFEGSNVIENHIEAKPICATWNSGNAVQALHDPTGTIANIIPGRNNTNWAVTNEAYRWEPDVPPGPQVVTYEWYDGATLVGTGATITVCPAVTTTYTVNVIDCTGLIATDDVIVNVSCCGPPTMDSTNVTCFGACDGTVTAVGDGVAPFTYLWDDPLAQTTETATGLCPGTYTCIVTDASGCAESGTITITEPPAVTATEVIVDETCEDDCDGSIDITATVGVAPFTFSIDGCVSSSASGTFTGLCDGVYDVCVTDADGCQYLNTVNVIGGPVVGDATITPVGPYCRDASPVTMTAVSPGGVWSGTGMSGSTFDPAAAGPGTHSITYQITGMCGDSDTKDIIVYDLPVVDPVADVTVGCAPLTVNFTSAGDPGVDCTWNFGDGTGGSSCTDLSHVYNNDGIYDVGLTVTDANGCVNSTMITDYITVYPVPKAEFTWDPMDADISNPVINFTDLSDDATTWQWTFEDVMVSNEQNPKVEFPSVRSYEVELIVTSSGSCQDSITKLITIKDVIIFYIPNTFSPDGDEYNEQFKPQFTSGIDIYDYHMTIFNRWGELVWESYNPAYGWDGTYGNRGLSLDDSYVWRLDFKETMSDKRHEHYGHVTILK